MSDFSRRVLAWYRAQGRDLPWRQTRDAYRIFMSELMLQQTQVDRVIPKYEAWLKTFPTWRSLAQASTADLIHAWAGLGYNRRALFAREAAKQVVEDGVPTDESGWRKLKGVGPYMAAALTAFVNHKRAIVIDTNIRRVVGRAQNGILFPKPTDDAVISHAIDEVLPDRGEHWDIPQVLMDIGSAICTPKAPKCSACPLQKICKATKEIQTAPAPKRTTIKAQETVREGKKYPDRIYRGRILSYIRENGATQLRLLGPRVDPEFSLRDADWLEAMASRLAKDGLIVISPDDILSLPNS